MLVACQVAGLSALEGHYAGVSVSAQQRQGHVSNGGCPVRRIGRIAGRSRREAAWRSRFQSGGRHSLAGSRARSPMKGPAPCDGASLATGVAARGNLPSIEGQGGKMAGRGLIAR
jgi:hypothetical protein